MDADVYVGIGAYAEYVAVSTKMLVHKPKELSWEVAAADIYAVVERAVLAQQVLSDRVRRDNGEHARC